MTKQSLTLTQDINGDCFGLSPAKELVPPAKVLYVGQVGEQVALAMTVDITPLPSRERDS
jgi:hypothetical protein